MDFTGTPGDDNITGTSGDDVFDIRQGGDDTAQGLGGKDLFLLGASLTAADTIDGGTGADTLRLYGDYSAGVTFAATTLANIETIQLKAGSSYNLTTDDANVAAGAALRIDAHTLGAGDTLAFNGAAESDGRFQITAGAGDDNLIGGLGNDTFTLTAGGADSVAGRGGNDVFVMGDALTAADHLDGGSGFDTVELDGDYSGAHALTLAPTTLIGIEKIALAAGHSYTLTTDNATVADGAKMVVDASALGAGNALDFDGAAESDGTFRIFGDAGNDRIVAGNFASAGGGGDTIDISQGGNDIVDAGGGDDHIVAGAALNRADAIDGGSGFNSLSLNGDYSGANALVLGGTTVANIGQLLLGGAHDYAITENDRNLAAGQIMTVSITDQGAASTAIFDGSAETDAAFRFNIGVGNATLTGGALADTFTGTGALDILSGGGGDDHFTMTTQLTAADRIDGGAGSDELTFVGGFNIAFAADTIRNVETIDFAPHDNTTFNIVENDGNLAAGATLTVDARAPRTNSHVNFDGSAETDGHFVFLNGYSPDNFIGGALADTFEFGRPEITSGTGGGGADSFTVGTQTGTHVYTFVYNAVSDSTSTVHDTISGPLNFTGHAVFDVHAAGGAVTGVDAAVTTGSLSTATFDSDLAGDVGAGQMAAHHAVLFTASAGTLSGHTFLVVDENGAAGYQAGADLVIDVTGATGTLTTANFS